MASFTQIYYHIVFSTKSRRRTLDADGHDTLYGYMAGIIKNHRCHAYHINGMEDHLHISASLHPTQCLADLIKDIKVSTSLWIKDQGIFQHFEGWQEGYGAFTYAHKDQPHVVGYIKNQALHHKRLSFREEFAQMLQRAGIVFEEKYLD